MTEYIKFYSGDSRTQEDYSPEVSFGDICFHIKKMKMYQVYKAHGGAIKVCDGWEEEFEKNTSSLMFSRSKVRFAIRADLPPNFLRGMKRIISSPAHHNSYFFTSHNDIGSNLMKFFKEVYEEIPSMHELTEGYYRIESFTYKLRSDEEIYLMNERIREIEISRRNKEEMEDVRISYIKALKRGISEIRGKWMKDYMSNHEIMTMIMDLKISLPEDVSSDDEEYS